MVVLVQSLVNWIDIVDMMKVVAAIILTMLVVERELADAIILEQPYGRPVAIQSRNSASVKGMSRSHRCARR